MLRRFPVSRIFLKHFIPTIGMAAFVLVTTLLVTSRQYEEQFRAQVHQTHDLLARRMAKEMGVFFEQSQKQLLIAATMIKYLRPEPARLRLAFNEFTLTTRHFENVALYDIHGGYIANSSLNAVGEDYLDPKGLATLRAGEMYTDTISFARSRVPYVTIAAPIIRLGKVERIVVGKLNLKKMWRWIDQINTLSDTNLSVVRQADGVVVADQSKALIGRRHPYWGMHFLGETLIVNGKERFISFHDVPNVQMTVITLSDRETFFSMLYETRYTNAAYLAIFLLVAALIALGLSLRTARPAMRLVTSIQNFGLREDVRVPTGTMKGEFELIGQAFNKLADELEDKRDALVRQESLVVVGRIAASLAHELRHGLHMIQNMIYLLKGADTETKTMLTTTVKEMTAKIRDLLEFARTGHLILEETDIDLIIDELVSAARYHDISQKINFIIENNSRQSVITVDRSKLVAALTNLLRNAIDAAATEVRFQFDTQGGYHHFTVIDNGPGVSDDKKETIFKPFFTTRTKGFGLGLALARTIARSHGGELSLLPSEAEGGARFRLTVATSLKIVPERTDGGDGGRGELPDFDDTI